MMKERIVCFTDNLGSGGAQRQMVGLACMLKERGYDVSVVLYYDTPFYKPLLDDAGIESTVVKNSNYIGRIWSMYKYFWKNKGATIIAYQETPSLIACLLRPFIRCRKLIVSERNTTQTISKMDKLRFWLYRFSDYIVPNSYSQADFIGERYPKLKPKITTITNFVDTDYFKPMPRLNSSTISTNTIVVVGSRKPQKNFHRFVDAVKILADDGVKFHVKWYGISPEYLEEFRKYVADTGLSSIFNVFGPTQNIREIYQYADLFCLPSLFEGFPNVLCEAMSTGLPIACSNVCDNPSIVKESVNGYLFNPKNVDEMAKTIGKLLELSNETKLIMSRHNREKAVRAFSRQTFVEQYISLIKS